MKKIGITSPEDFLYAIATIILGVYISLILIVTLLQNLGIELSYQVRFILLPLNLQFPFLLLLCVLLMYSSVLVWLIMGIASLFYRKKKDLILLRNTPYLISVIIPAHNEKRVIKNILLDLIKQKYRRLEIIVVAHNCTDSTIKIAKTIKDPRIKIIKYHSRKSGKGLALNKGLKYASGEIIAQFDADNRIKDPFFFNRAIVYFLKDKQITAIQSTLLTSNSKGYLLSFLQEIEYDIFSSISWTGRSVLNLPCFLAGTGILVKKQILERIGGWSNSLVEDFELFTRLTLKRKKIIYADNLCVFDEKPITWSAIMKQRSRWIKGHLGVTWRYIDQLGNWLDYIYRLSPLAVFAWWMSNLLYIFYLFTGQISIVNINSWIWIGWTLFFFLIMTITVWKKRGPKRIIYLPLYWIFGFHWFFVVLYSLGVKNWSETKTTHFGTLLSEVNTQAKGGAN
ncbi:glycosyltransferase [bacterium]|nr:glycosyltransferase [bacterium]